MAQQKAALLKTVVVSGCSRLLSKGREVILRGGLNKENLGSDAFDTWSHLCSGHEDFISGALPLPRSFSFHIHYQDEIDPTKPPERVVLTSHGSPGSHEDFKYMTPNLVNSGDGFRVLNLNWPGHGHSEVSDETEYFYCHSSDERSEMLSAFLNGLQIKKVDVMVGHSFGCYPLMTFGADETYRRYCKALLLINCGGTYPNKSNRPYSFFKILATLSYHPMLGSTSRAIFYVGSRLIGLKVRSAESAANNLMVISHLGYQQLPQRLEILRTDPQTPRVLYVYAEDDRLIEPACSESLVHALGCSIPPVVGCEDDALKKVEKWWKTWNAKNPGGEKKNLAVNFGKGRGGHYLQKHEANFLVSCIRIMSVK